MMDLPQSPPAPPKVSVIIPVFKAEDFIERCTRSLMEQTLDEMEFLFIDDCTPDGSMEVLMRTLSGYPARQGQVVLHRMERNSGQAAVREWGCRHARGEFVIHCDSDDWVEPEMYRQLYDKACRENADIVICDYDVTDGTEVLEIHPGCVGTDKDLLLRRMLLQKDSWSLCNKLVRRDPCYGEGLRFPEGDLGEDMVLTFQLLLNAGKVAYVPGIFYHYFSHPGSITHTEAEDRRMVNFRHNKVNADLVFDLFREKGLSDSLADEIVYAKWCVRRQLWLTRFDKERYALWDATYPETDRHILLSPQIIFREKVKYILTRLRIYPFRKAASAG